MEDAREHVLCARPQCHRRRFRGAMCRACYAQTRVLCAHAGCRRRAAQDAHGTLAGDRHHPLCARHTVQAHGLTCQLCPKPVTNYRYALCHMHYVSLVYRRRAAKRPLLLSQGSAASDITSLAYCSEATSTRGVEDDDDDAEHEEKRACCPSACGANNYSFSSLSSSSSHCSSVVSVFP